MLWLVNSVLRLVVSSLFLTSAVPKLQGQGSSPPPALIGRILSKSASWFELEVDAAAYVWQHEFKLPLFLMRPISSLIIGTTLILNIFPSPHLFGTLASMLLLSVLGAGLHAMLLVYKSPKHALHAIFTAIGLIYLQRSHFIKTYAYFWASLLPVYFGFVCGSVITAYSLNGGFRFNVKKRKKRLFRY